MNDTQQHKVSAKSKRKARPLFDPPRSQTAARRAEITALARVFCPRMAGHKRITRERRSHTSPVIVEKIIIGRSIKGLTKDMWIEDLRDGLIMPAEVFEWAYSAADAQDVINRANSLRNDPGHGRRTVAGTQDDG